MKRAWLDHVRDTREKNNRGKKTCTYREAMGLASSTWADKKAKIERAVKRENRAKGKAEKLSKGV
jgi:hypothetical protein